MATYIKSLKEDNGDIILPQTSADAVLASDDTTVQSKLDNYATVNKTTSSATTATNCVLKDASGNELHPTTDFTQVNGTVPTAKIASSAVTSAKLASSAVTTAKIADSAVTSAKIDWTTLSSYGTATLNSSYFNNGSAQWVKIGKIVILNIIDANLSTSPADNSWTIAAITGLPARGSSSSWNYKFNIPGASGGTPLRLGFQPEATTMYFHFSASSAKTDYNASIVYEAADV